MPFRIEQPSIPRPVAQSQIFSGGNDVPVIAESSAAFSNQSDQVSEGNFDDLALSESGDTVVNIPKTSLLHDNYKTLQDKPCPEVEFVEQIVYRDREPMQSMDRQV